ncbi:acyl-CoA dehydrogenase C-terminal domain-containing protein [Aurantiacibacter gangjinensis]|uniref:3-methylmercaptopropionyl-CoA dehydrogenase n=1 Tax=Aurantiacibacter gangjinensis TaxID=502682 RepID=A0A0G9MPK0_9SPHN|nr:acyl-CoA dehydrogenase C-terminal domain-containing protein [Aurantiacibacter gangjinensis]APE28420.1 Acyl-CoA dehydrogenase [Aurantiacibacter gangjinensis]KLE32641.1 acyl-CoA dehydrogenase [Aurantiacibacter gangjinensis]
MQVYDAPIRDMRFNLEELHAEDGFGDLEGFEDFDEDMTSAILEEANKLCRDVLLPINWSGDQEGCRIENGVVRTPKGFPEAYKQFCEGGWAGLTVDQKWGGQGAPHSLGKMVEEMSCSTNLSFGLYPGLTNGAMVSLEAYGSEDQKSFYMPKMANGEWSGTMCLTEPHCGTDLGMLRTKAEPQEDGSYKITGNKIFISAGDHDLAENIIHLVLARLPDAPPGVKGISMFLVPKFMPKDDGSLGDRNPAVATAIEHKMGLKASATCQMSFDGATGWLVGKENRGLEAMFAMMNTERVAVGIQGLGVGEIAYQSSVYYAKERLQGRSLSGVKNPDGPADPIIVHPDVRRMLMTMRCYNEGSRAVSAWVARALDAEHAAKEPEARERAKDFVALMTPVVKALFTDLGHEASHMAIQIHGGHGYIQETGIEQFARDARIAQIYEGANGIQALDLVGRKLPDRMGRNLRSFFHPVSQFIEDHEGDEKIGKMIGGLQQAFGALQMSTGHIAQKGLKDPEEAGAAATDYLRLLGFVAMGYCFANAAKKSYAKLKEGTDEKDFYEAKIITARFFFDRLLPPVMAQMMAITSGKSSMMDMPAEAF